MKKLIKLLIIICVFNFLISFGFLGWIYSSLIFPSLKDAEISFFELFNKEIDLEKYEKFEKNIMLQADNLSDKIVNKIKNIVNVLLPDPNFNYSDIPCVEYPYPSLEEVINYNSEHAAKGLKEGINILLLQENP